jgi:hypothetical protein
MRLFLYFKLFVNRNVGENVMDRVRKTIIAIAALILLSVSLAGCANNKNDELAMVSDKPIERWYYELYV